MMDVPNQPPVSWAELFLSFRPSSGMAIPKPCSVVSGMLASEGIHYMPSLEHRSFGEEVRSFSFSLWTLAAISQTDLPWDKASQFKLGKFGRGLAVRGFSRYPWYLFDSREFALFTSYLACADADISLNKQLPVQLVLLPCKLRSLALAFFRCYMFVSCHWHVYRPYPCRSNKLPFCRSWLFHHGHKGAYPRYKDGYRLNESSIRGSRGVIDGVNCGEWVARRDTWVLGV